MPDLEDTRRLSLSPRVRFRAVGDEGVLVNVESGRVVVLNETGLHVVQELERGVRSPVELVGSLVAAFAVETAAAEVDLTAFLAELDAEQVLLTEAG